MHRRFTDFQRIRFHSETCISDTNKQIIIIIIISGELVFSGIIMLSCSILYEILRDTTLKCPKLQAVSSVPVEPSQPSV